jgi:cell division septation protein DedD
LANSLPAHNNLIDEELLSIRRKRALLERLIAFTRQVHRLAGSFDILKEMVKPSQRTNKKYLQALYAAMQEYEAVETNALQEDLRAVDQRIQQRLQGIIALSMRREADFLKLFEARSDSEAPYTRIDGELKAFEDLVQQNLAMRYVLDQRGAIKKSCRLPISQEDVRVHADRLKKEEAACKKRIEQKIQELIQDTETLLANAELPDDLKSSMKTVRANLNRKLDALQTDNMDDAIKALEHFDLDACDEQRDTPSESPQKQQKSKEKNKREAKAEAKHATANKPTANTTRTPKAEEKVTGIKAFVRWLNTPWGVSYEDIKEKKKKKDTDG